MSFLTPNSGRIITMDRERISESEGGGGDSSIRPASKAVCAYCERRSPIHPDKVKSEKEKALEEIAVDYFKRRVLRGAEEASLNETGTIVDDVVQCDQILSTVALCETCVLEFCHHEMNILQNQMHYLDKMTGPKEFGDLLADTWLDLKRYAYAKLKYLQPSIAKKLRLIEEAISSSSSSQNGNFTVEPQATTSSSARQNDNLPARFTSTPIVHQVLIDPMNYPMPSVTSVSVEVSNDLFPATCQFTTSSGANSDSSGSTTPIIRVANVIMEENVTSAGPSLADVRSVRSPSAEYETPNEMEESDTNRKNSPSPTSNVEKKGGNNVNPPANMSPVVKLKTITVQQTLTEIAKDSTPDGRTKNMVGRKRPLESDSSDNSDSGSSGDETEETPPPCKSVNTQPQQISKTNEQKTMAEAGKKAQGQASLENEKKAEDCNKKEPATKTVSTQENKHQDKLPGQEIESEDENGASEDDSEDEEVNESRTNSQSQPPPYRTTRKDKAAANRRAFQINFPPSSRKPATGRKSGTKINRELDYESTPEDAGMESDGASSVRSLKSNVRETRTLSQARKNLQEFVAPSPKRAKISTSSPLNGLNIGSKSRASQIFAVKSAPPSPTLSPNGKTPSEINGSSAGPSNRTKPTPLKSSPSPAAKTPKDNPMNKASRFSSKSKEPSKTDTTKAKSKTKKTEKPGSGSRKKLKIGGRVLNQDSASSDDPTSSESDTSGDSE